MGDIALAIAREQWHGDAPDTNRRVASVGSQKDVPQRAIVVRIVRHELAERCAQDIAFYDPALDERRWRG